MLVGIAPHFSEHIWTAILKNPQSIQLAEWPTPSDPVDHTLIEAGQYMRGTIKTIRDAEHSLLKALTKAKGKSSTDTFYDPKKPKAVQLSFHYHHRYLLRPRFHSVALYASFSDQPYYHSQSHLLVHPCLLEFWDLQRFDKINHALQNPRLHPDTYIGSSHILPHFRNRIGQLSHSQRVFMNGNR